MTLLELLIDDGVRLKGSGAQRTGLCPFHEDTSPSFSVNVEEGVYHCFTCGAKGNAQTWLVERRGMEPSEAAEWLRERGAGPPAPARRRRRSSASPPKVYTGLPSKVEVVHPYVDADGTTLWVVVRYPKGHKPKCQNWTPVEGGYIAKGPAASVRRPLYRLPKILAAPEKRQVWIVEGEKCVEAVEKVCRGAIVTTWCGGAGEGVWSKTDWTPLHGRPVMLIADDNEVGRVAMRAVAEHLGPHCPSIRMALPEGDTGLDIADWIDTDGWKGAAAKVAGMAKDAPKPPPVTPPPGDDGDDDEDDATPVRTDGIEANHYFRIIGNIGEAVAVMLRTHRLLLCSRQSLTQPGQLVAIAPNYDWWLATIQQKSLSRSACQQVGSHIIAAADHIGQIDPHDFLGRGPFRHNGGVGWHLGDRLLIDGQEHKLDDVAGVVPIAGARVNLGATPATVEERRSVAAAVMRYRWETPKNGKRFLGWLVAAALGGALDWRPHAWMTAPAEAGKTWLITSVVRPILGGLLIHTGDTTAAGFARAAGSDALAVAFDEAEADAPQVDQVLDLARLASGGDGARIRADRASSGFDVLTPRFSLLMLSIKMAALNHANASRFASIQLSRHTVDDWPAVKKGILAALARPEPLLTAIVHEATAILARVKELEDHYVGQGVSSRRAAIEAALGAGWEWWSGESEVVLDHDEDSLDQTPTDAEDLVRYLLGLRLKEGVHDASVARVLQNGDSSKVARDYGFRLDRELQVLWIATRHPSLVDKLQRTRWGSVDLKRTLLQLDGVVAGENPISFGGGVKTRAIAVPQTVCDQLGLAVFEQPEGADDTLPYDTAGDL